jgi:hypothetical protein
MSLTSCTICQSNLNYPPRDFENELLEHQLTLNEIKKIKYSSSLWCESITMNLLS